MSVTTAEQNWIVEVWNTELYQQLKKENFELASKYLPVAPKKILDIGCGLAWESRLFNQTYGSELWLLDGDTENNDTKSPSAGTGDYHSTSDEFLYYYPLQKIDEELKKLGTENYHLIDCNNIQIDENIKFDLITSWVSCGFHYPSSTYRDLILKHSHPDTKIIFDIRIKTKQSTPFLEPGVEIVNRLNQRRKYVTAEIKFV
jgi:SAM-dependent methyltransferase